MEIDNTIEVFGPQQETRTMRRRGSFLFVNFKNRCIHLSGDLADEMFAGESTGKIKIVHSKIENNWYLMHVASTEDGFTCRRHGRKGTRVMRIADGAIKIAHDIMTSFGVDLSAESRYRMPVEKTDLSYQNNALYQIKYQ